MRPTITDLAKEAGVSKTTVNRILGGTYPVRQPTIDRVLDAAERIGFYGLQALKSRADARKPIYKLGFLLLQSDRVFYQEIKRVLDESNKEFEGYRVEVNVEFLDDSTPRVVAARLLALAEKVDAIAAVLSQYPEITRAVDSIIEMKKPVLGLLSPINSSKSQVGYVGLDNWKVGRAAAWMIDKLSANANNRKVAILMGNARFRCQDLNESGFRSYFREHGTDLTLLEPLSTHESSFVADELVTKLLAENDDLAAIYVAGGGISGVLRALERLKPTNRPFIVGYELIDSTIKGIVNGTLDIAISHPLEQLAQTAITSMVKAIVTHDDGGSINKKVQFEIHFSETI